MSANIEFNRLRNNHSFFTVKEPAWHGLGTIVSEAKTSEEAIILANLDFQIDTAPLWAKYPNDYLETLGKAKRADNVYCTFRTDNGHILTNNGRAVTSSYEPIQNTEAFNFFDNIVGSKQAVFETAGVLGNGETIFMTAKLPDYIRIGITDDIIDKYLLLTMNHDGTGSVKALFTPIRVVCNNTLNYALSTAKSMVKIRHTASAHNRMKEGEKLLGLANKQAGDAEYWFNKLAQIRVDDKTTVRLLANAFLLDEEYIVEQNRVILTGVSARKKNQFNDILSSVYNGVGQRMITTDSTLFGIYNGVSYYYQNVKNYESSNNPNVVDTLEKKMRFNFLGTSGNKMDKVASVIDAYANSL